MVLPNPDYLTNENINWNASQVLAVLLTTDAAITASKRFINWNAIDRIDGPLVHDLIMGYNDRLAIPETEANAVLNFAAGAGYQTINFGGLATGNTGLQSVTYTTVVTENGVDYNIDIAGASASTFADLITALNVALPASLSASIFDGNVEISTVATGSGNVVSVSDQSLFRSIINFRGVPERRVGVTTISDVFDLNNRHNYQPYSECFGGALTIVQNKSPKTANTIHDVYFNHGTATWLLTYTDVAPV